MGGRIRSKLRDLLHTITHTIFTDRLRLLGAARHDLNALLKSAYSFNRFFPVQTYTHIHNIIQPTGVIYCIALKCKLLTLISQNVFILSVFPLFMFFAAANMHQYTIWFTYQMNMTMIARAKAACWSSWNDQQPNKFSTAIMPKDSIAYYSPRIYLICIRFMFNVSIFLVLFSLCV